MNEETLEAMNEAARNFVDIRQLNAKAGETIAGIIGAEAAVVTSGAAAGIVLSTAACIAGKDVRKMKQLPDTTEMKKNEIIVQRAHMVPYEQMIRMGGGKIVEVGHVNGTEPWELETAIGERTAAIFHVVSHDCLQRAELTPRVVTQIGRKHGVPTIVDAASEVPPMSNFKRWIDLGFDLVIYSGGKAIGGPNDTGFVYGRRDLIESCAMQNAPNLFIGRPFKVSKEQIVGLIVALESYVRRDHQHDVTLWQERTHYLLKQLENIPNVKAEIMYPDETGLPVPRVRVYVDEQAIGRRASEIIKDLRDGDPSIVTRYFEQNLGIIVLDVMCLKDGEEKIVAERLKQLLITRK